MINVIIDGKEYRAEEGKTILDICRENHIEIPTLCYFKRLGPIGTCRMCIVEVEGLKIPVASCTTRVKDGMVIKTKTEKIERLRRENLKILLTQQPLSMFSVFDEDNELSKLVHRYGISASEIMEYGVEPVNYKAASHPSPILVYNPHRCVLCGRCIEACIEITRIGALMYDGRGASTVVNGQKKTIFYSPQCISCGECMSVCPVNAIEFEKAREIEPRCEVKTVETICPYCGVGCTVLYRTTGEKILGVEKKYEKGVNNGSLCVKGRFGYDYVTTEYRIKSPMVKRNGNFVPITWDEAYDIIRVKFMEIKAKYGPDSIMGLSSAKCTNEDNYLFQKFMRAAIGTNNVDHCARLCHSSTVAGLKEVFGAGAMTNSIEDMTKADVIFVIGSNTTEAHPIIGTMLKRSVDRLGKKLIVVDPRRIELTKFASLWLSHRPGTDIALVNGIANIIYKRDMWDREFVEKRTQNFDEYLNTIEKYDPETVSKICGVPVDNLYKAAELLGNASCASFVYAMGITQHKAGCDFVKSIANLALLTGNVGKERSGVNPLRGQNNVQGACDMGALPNVYPGYMGVGDASVRRLFEVVWGVDDLPSKPGLEASLLSHAILEGKIKGLYVMGENPAITDANLLKFRESLNQLEFMVVQDIFFSETAKYADLVLPAASLFETDGTVTNTERRVQLVRKVLDPVGNSKPDWEILTELLHHFGIKGSYDSIEDVFNEIREVVPQYRGITYNRLKKGGIQWPCPDVEHPGTKFLYKDGFSTSTGKGYFYPTEQPSYEDDFKGYEYTLTTGRTIYHFHSGTMSRKSYALDKLVPKGYVCINPEDAKSLGIGDGNKVKLISSVGELIAPVKLSDMVPSKVVFSTFHFSELPINTLTPERLDPVCKIPEYKVIPVNLEKVV